MAQAFFGYRLDSFTHGKAEEHGSNDQPAYRRCPALPGQDRRGRPAQGAGGRRSGRYDGAQRARRDLARGPVASGPHGRARGLLDRATDSRSMRNAADASLAFGVLGALGAAITGLSDWRYLEGGSRRMGVAHGLLNAVGLTLSITSLILRAAGRRNAGRLVFLAGYSVSGTAAHLGGELSYNYGLRVNRNAFEEDGPEDYVAVMDEAELPQDGTRRVEVDGAGILLSRSSSGEVCAISSVCSHLGGPLEEGEREGDTVICPWHGSRFDLCSGGVIDGPAVFPQPRYETRVREGRIEVRAAEERVS